MQIVSIDGLEKTHDEFRGMPGSYNIIKNNIKALRETNFCKTYSSYNSFSQKEYRSIR